MPGPPGPKKARRPLKLPEAMPAATKNLQAPEGNNVRRFDTNVNLVRKNTQNTCHKLIFCTRM